MSITWHTCIELIHAADPSQSGLGEVVQGHQVKISREAMDGADANLMQSPEEILGDSDGLRETLCPDARHVGELYLF